MPIKESIAFDFSALCVPPWALGEWELVYLPFPEGSEHIKHPFHTEHPFFSHPIEAFDESDENLLVFREKRLFGNERVGTRPLPARPISAELLLPELFSRIKLANESPEELMNLLNASGLIISPLYGSQVRFIDSRFDSATGDPHLDYLALHPLTVKVDEGTSGDLADAMQAVSDISHTQHSSLGGSDHFTEPFASLSGGSMVEAVALSEYARRVLCRSDSSAAHGGVISYYEVLFTLRALFRSMNILIDFSIAGSSVTKLTEQLAQKVKEDSATAFQHFALDMFASSEDKAIQRTHRALNILEPDVRTALDFIQRCVSAGGNARYGKVVRKSASLADIHDGVSTKIPKCLEPAYSFYRQEEPRYFTDRYCEGSFSAALSAQFLNTLASPTSWKRCDNPECRAWFKHHFSGQSRTNSKATSCSPTCSTRKRNRLYNKEATVIRTASKKFKSPKAALAYVEHQLKDEFERVSDLQKARQRWIKKLRQHM